MTDASEGTQRVEQAPHCYRHPDRETYIRCQRCDRPICPDCMHQASVGFQCPECVAEGRGSAPRVRTAYGGTVRGDSNLVTKLLIGVNVAVFALIQLTGRGGSSVLLELAMVGSGAAFDPSVEGVADGAFWRLLTSAFVHVQALHLLFNMFALWVFGPMLESLLGRLRFAVLYLLCGLAGSVAVYLLSSPFAFTVGASGAVFGLLGAALVVSVRRGYDVRWLVGLLGINIVFSLVAPSISWQGHFGGLAAGLVLGAAVAYAPRDRRGLVQWGTAAGLLLLFLLAVAWRTAALQGLG